MLGRFALGSRIFGSDPKLEFRTSLTSGVSLLSGPPIPLSSPYWQTYYTLFDSPSEVLTLLDSPLLTHCATHAPTNLLTLVEVLAGRLFELLEMDEFPNGVDGSVGGGSGGGWLGGAGGGGRGGEGEVDLAKEALNCVRVLSRVVPFVMGDDGLEERVFWRREKVRVILERKTTEAEGKKTEGAKEEEGQFVIDDDEDEDDPDAKDSEEEKKDLGTKEEEEEWTELAPLAERLLAALVDLCFIPGLTVPIECRNVPSTGAVSYVIWEPGIANPPSSPPTAPTHPSLLSARLEVLRLLLLLLSLPSLLTPSTLYPTTQGRTNLWREALVDERSGVLERKVALCLLSSVLNTAFADGAPPVASGEGEGGGARGLVSGAAGKFGEVVLRREDVKGLLVGACLELLGVLLVVHGGSSTPDESNGIEMNNAFVFYLRKLHRVGDFSFLVRGVIGLINGALEKSFSLQGLVGSATGGGVGAVGGGSGGANGGARWATETILVLWRMVEINNKMTTTLSESGLLGEVLSALAVVALEFKDDPAQMGLVRLATNLLQTLTAEKGLATRLNAPVELRLALRPKYGVPGTLSDFLIVSIYTLVFTTKARLSTLYPAFMLIIDNISPHIKNISKVAATKLVQLFLALSAPSFCLMEEGNPRLVFYLLETFNNVIHFNLSDNPELIYALIKSSQRFQDLSTFTLATGVAEARRIKLERKANNSNATSSSTTSTPVSPPSSSTPATPSVDDPNEKSKEVERAEGAGVGMGMTSVTQSVAELGLLSPPIGGEPTPSLEEGVFVGKNGFVPTEGWVASWREGLPLDSILIALTELTPLVTSSTHTQAISLLSSASLASLLPSPPPTPRARKFLFTPASTTWLASLIYGSVFLNQLELLRETKVRLFGVASSGGTGGGGVGAGGRRLVDGLGEMVQGVGGFFNLGRGGSATTGK